VRARACVFVYVCVCVCVESPMCHDMLDNDTHLPAVCV
jgi:hypothetical protein